MEKLLDIEFWIFNKYIWLMLYIELMIFCLAFNYQCHKDNDDD